MIQAPVFKHNETEDFIVDETLAKIYPNISRSELCNWLVSPPKMTFLRVNTLKITRSELIEKIRLVFCTYDFEKNLISRISRISKIDVEFSNLKIFHSKFYPFKSI